MMESTDITELPDLSNWRFVEIWTIEEAALLWAAIDPLDHLGSRIQELRGVLPLHQFKKALISQRAISEAVCGGTLPFVDAWEFHEDSRYDGYEKEVEFPDVPDLTKLIPHRTRIRQAAFLKWADSKKILSYRQEIQKARGTSELKVIEHGTHNASIVVKDEPARLPAPGFLDPNHPLSPAELRAAHDAWHAVTAKGDPRTQGVSVKAEIRKFLDSHSEYSRFTEDAKKRICTVVNWDKKGGAPKTPG